MLDGCPENGPALAVDDRQRIHIVWPTLVPAATAGVETLALFYATSSDGQHFTTRQRVPTQGVPRHPQIAVGLRGEITVAWDEQAGGARRVALARGALDPSGVARLVRQTIVDAAPAVYPVLGAVDDGMVVAWTSGPGGQTVIRAERLDNRAGPFRLRAQRASARYGETSPEPWQRRAAPATRGLKTPRHTSRASRAGPLGPARRGSRFDNIAIVR